MTSARPTCGLAQSTPALLDGDCDADLRAVNELSYDAWGTLQAKRRDLGQVLGVSVAEFSVLTALMYLERHEESIRVRTVADHLRVSGAQVTAIVGKLQSGGWVDKASDPEDSRAVSLTLTEQTRDRLAAFAPHLRAVNDRWFEGATKEEVTAVGVFLRRMVRQYDSASLKARDVAPDNG